MRPTGRLARVPLAAALGVLVTVVGAPRALATNDPLWGQQYGPRQIFAPEAWERARGDGVIIAVIDSGVDVDHPDLAPKLVLVPGADVADNDDDPDDDSTVKDGEGKSVVGHGTGVAGVAAAVTDNARGIAGVAPDARIMPIKVFPTAETGALGAVLVTAVPRAIRLAVDNGARVINLSLGTFQGTDLVGLIETPCAEAFQRGSLCVVASGNSGTVPSGYDRDVQFLVVTANDERGEHAPFGQKADTQWSVTAPGVAVTTTTTIELGSYTTVNGTSFSAPHAAGVAALLFSTGLSAPEVVDRILSTATPMGDGGAISGAGLINAAAAVGAPFRHPTTTTVAPPAGEGAPAPTTAVTAAPGGPTPAPPRGPATPTGPATPAGPSTTLATGTIDDDFLGGGPGDEALFDTETASRPIGVIGDNVKDTPAGLTPMFLAGMAVFLLATFTVVPAVTLGVRRLWRARHPVAGSGDPVAPEREPAGVG